ncbi:MAG: hypothetical protein IT292_01735 [Deltaproteobacteria bacterium]|nr:hypothetical protein [Deltaproteobacteria bacterium]
MAERKNIRWLNPRSNSPVVNNAIATADLTTGAFDQMRDPELNLTQEQAIALLHTLRESIRPYHKGNSGNMLSSLLPTYEAGLSKDDLYTRLESKLLAVNSDVDLSSSDRHSAELNMLRQVIDWLDCSLGKE